MATIEEYAERPRDERLKRLTRTADELAASIGGQSEEVLCRRPDAKRWAAKEVVCHLRDTEEVFAARIEQVLAMALEPTFVISNPDRWAEDRQYLANHVDQALAAFRRRRLDTLAMFGKLVPAEWEKAGIHPVLGRITVEDFLAIMAAHDDTHLDQLARALEGRA